MLKSFFGDIKNHLKRDNRIGISDLLSFIVLYFIAIIVYQFFINNLLISNNDPMVLSTFSFAGKIVISLGRWFLPIIDILLAGVKAEPLQTYGALFFLCVSIVWICKVLSINSIVSRVIFGIFIITSPSVYYLLSFRYTSLEYFIGLLCSVACAYFVICVNDLKLKYIVGTVFFILTLAIYQYFISVTGVIVLISIINNYSKKENIRNNNDSICASFVIFLAGCLIYKIVWEVFKFILKLNASTYRGMEKISFANILISVPKAFLNSYLHFFNYYFCGSIIKYNVFRVYIFGGILLLMMLCKIVYDSYKNNITKNKQFLNFVLTVAFVLLLPPVLSITNFLTPGDLSMDARGTIPYAMLFPLLALLMLSDKATRVKHMSFMNFKGLIVLIMVIVLHCQLLQMSVDFDCMYNSKNASTNVMSILLSKLNNKNLLDSKHKYLFFGDLGKNELYYVEDYKIPYTNLSLEPNPYFIVGKGDSMLNGDWDMQRRFGIVRNYMGVSINNNVDNFYAEVYKKYAYFVDTSEYINASPFPSDEGIFIVDDVVIVKLSN